MELDDSKVLKRDAFWEGILNGDSEVIQEFYATHFDGIVAFVVRNKGSVDDAKDIFQDAIMILYQKAKDPDFELEYTLYAYFYGICKNLWLQKLKQEKRIVAFLEKGDDLEENISIEEEMEERSKQKLFYSKFALLNEPCQQVLKLFFAKKTMEEIAQILELGSAGYAKKRKYKCQKKLMELIKADALYEELGE